MLSISSGDLGIPHICHKVHMWDMWRKICHVEKFQISIHDKCGEIWNFSKSVMWKHSRFLHMTNVEKIINICHLLHHYQINNVCHLWCFVLICAVLLQNQFVAIFAHNGHVTARLQYPQKCVIYEQNLRPGETRGGTWSCCAFITLWPKNRRMRAVADKMQEPGVRFEL